MRSPVQSRLPLPERCKKEKQSRTISVDCFSFISGKSAQKLDEHTPDVLDGGPGADAGYLDARIVLHEEARSPSDCA